MQKSPQRVRASKRASDGHRRVCRSVEHTPLLPNDLIRNIAELTGTRLTRAPGQFQRHRFRQDISYLVRNADRASWPEFVRTEEGKHKKVLRAHRAAAELIRAALALGGADRFLPMLQELHRFAETLTRSEQPIAGRKPGRPPKHEQFNSFIRMLHGDIGGYYGGKLTVWTDADGTTRGTFIEVLGRLAPYLPRGFLPNRLAQEPGGLALKRLKRKARELARTPEVQQIAEQWRFHNLQYRWQQVHTSATARGNTQRAVRAAAQLAKLAADGAVQARVDP
jgi:hypothetical protein